jgi:hypothetical protein
VIEASPCELLLPRAAAAERGSATAPAILREAKRSATIFLTTLHNDINLNLSLSFFFDSAMGGTPGQRDGDHYYYDAHYQDVTTAKPEPQ